MNWLRRLRTRVRARKEAGVDRILLAIGKQESRSVRAQTFSSLREAEFQVFSQWGEDGIIQYLLGKIPVPEKIFVEFGVGDYSESNTRFLLCNDNWRGLIIDSGNAHRDYLAASGLDWRYDLQAVSAFIDAANIDALIRNAGIDGDVGLLSIDLDGNDYWVLQAIEVIRPRILIVEYNSIFGPELSVAIPYRADFQRAKAHFSGLYYGASISALITLAAKKGFACVGGNSAGNNVFFVRSDVLGNLRVVPPGEAWAESRFRESRDPSGRLTFLGSHVDRLAQIASLPVLDLASGGERPIRELLDSNGRPRG
jgi:hypothetical protein